MSVILGNFDKLRQVSPPHFWISDSPAGDRQVAKAGVASWRALANNTGCSSYTPIHFLYILSTCTTTNSISSWKVGFPKEASFYLKSRTPAFRKIKFALPPRKILVYWNARPRVRLRKGNKTKLKEKMNAGPTHHDTPVGGTKFNLNCVAHALGAGFVLCRNSTGGFLQAINSWRVLHVPGTLFKKL